MLNILFHFNLSVNIKNNLLYILIIILISYKINEIYQIKQFKTYE